MLLAVSKALSFWFWSLSFGNISLTMMAHSIRQENNKQRMAATSTLYMPSRLDHLNDQFVIVQQKFYSIFQSKLLSLFYTIMLMCSCSNAV